MAKRSSVKTRQERTVRDTPAGPRKELKSERGTDLWLKVASALAALFLFLIIYLLRLDKVVGLVVDDAWYVQLGKGLATGKGYTLINSPSPGIVPFYPPAFPMLLSFVFRLSTDFPNNVCLLKSVSIAAMLGVGLVAFYYFFRHHGLPFYLSLGIALATIFYPALVFLATSTVMSECFFTLLLLLTMVVIERSVSVESRSAAWRYSLLGGVLASFCFLTRPVAVGLIIAAMVYFLRKRLTRSAVIFGVMVVLLVGPWMLYAGLHAPTAEQRAEQNGNIVQSYVAQFWQRTAGQPAYGTITLSDIPERVWNNVSEIVKYDVGAIAFYPLFRPIEPGVVMRIDKEARVFSLLLSLLAVLGSVSMIRERMTLAEITVPLTLLITVAWGWEQFRLLLPLVPFVIFYLLMGVRVIYRWFHRLYGVSKPGAVWAALTISVWSMVVLNVYNNVAYILKKYDPVPAYGLRWIHAFEENEALINHVGATLPKSEVIATQNPALLHLYTGHKTVSSDDPVGLWETWNRLGVRYLVHTSPYRLPDPDPVESQYKIIYSSNGNLNLRVIDLGLPSSRPVWGTGAPPIKP